LGNTYRKNRLLSIAQKEMVKDVEGYDEKLKEWCLMP
jgi:hypothetical protein